MRLAVKRVPDQMDWTVLDVEPEEWERRMADLAVSAAANGFPCRGAAMPARTNYDDGVAVAGDVRRLRAGRYVVLAGLAMLVLAVGVGYSWWRKAEEGIVQMQGDIANVVKLETIQAQGKTQGNTQDTQAAPRLQASVQSVEFLGDKAMAAVVVTRTLPAGMVRVQAEVRFYEYTPRGWQPTAPVAAFWGPTLALDTGGLRFAFGSKDRAVVEEIAPVATALYATMRRAAGQDPVADGLLVIEIVPGYVAHNVQVTDRRIRLTSPLLFRSAALPVAKTLSLLRSAVADQMAAAALRRTAVKTQWRTMAQGFGSWLAYSGAMQPAPAGQRAALRRLRLLAYSPLRLDNLCDGPARHDLVTQPMQAQHFPANPYELEQRAAAAEQLIEFIAAAYGIDTVPKLLQGFALYEDWATLAPAVLGISAGELEAAWHAARR
jgi:hypothetical protein